LEQQKESSDDLQRIEQSQDIQSPEPMAAMVGGGRLR
jgi:hypothetical protein